MSTRIGELLQRKGLGVVAVERDTTAFDALREMVMRGVGSALVVAGSELAGIFTERDYSRRVSLRQLDPHVTFVREVMTSDVCCVDMGTTVGHCMQLMSQHRCRHLPVIHDDVVVGVVSIGDCVAYLCDSVTLENGLLREYIAGKYPG